MSSNFNSGVLVKIAIIILDMLLNALTIIFFHHPTILLMLYILQDVGTIMSIIVLVISFSSTFVFQAGLISYLIIKFRSTIIICFLYLTISVAFHSFSLKARWNNSHNYEWSYLLYKKAALLLGDPKYYNDNQWLRDKIKYTG